MYIYLALNLGLIAISDYYADNYYIQGERGKDKQATEFEAKISASEVDGMSRVEHISWNQFNESTDLEL